MTKTRWLRDDYDIYYDAHDIFAHAVKGRRWTDRWHVAYDSVEVGDIFYLVLPEEHNSVQVRAVAVPADEDDRVDGLGPAYCADIMDVELEDGEPMCVRIEIESVVDMDHQLLLDDLELDDIESGAVLDDALADGVARRWDAHVDGLAAQGDSIRRPVPAG